MIKECRAVYVQWIINIMEYEKKGREEWVAVIKECRAVYSG